MLDRETSESAANRARGASEALARLIRDELKPLCLDCDSSSGVDIDPRELALFLRNNWARISEYAHLIHGGS